MTRKSVMNGHWFSFHSTGNLHNYIVFRHVTQDNNAISVIYVVAYEIFIDIVIVNHYKGYDCK